MKAIIYYLSEGIRGLFLPLMYTQDIQNIAFSTRKNQGFRNNFRLLITSFTLCVLLVFSATAQISSLTYSCTGAPQDFVVPPCVTEITVKCWGAGGGGGGNDSYPGGSGGGGSFVTAIIPTTPGETITIYVGCQGVGGGACAGNAPGGPGGWGFGIAGNGGNAGPSGCSGGGGGGGGSSAVSRAGTALIGASGGGGGGGGGCTSLGGYGGYGTTNGSNTTCTSGGVTAGSGNPNGTNGGTMNQDGGGGGGGAGGVSNGGNGGSAPPPGGSCNAANDCGAGGAGAGDSFIPVGGTLINSPGQAAANDTDPDLCAGCGVGGASQGVGGHGMVVLTFSLSPTADFSAASVCFGNDVSFMDLSCNTVVNWNWDFGDAQTSTAQNPTHNYAAPGVYTVTLIVTDSLGVMDTTSQNIDIHLLPVAGFSAGNVCAYDTTQFFDNTVYPGVITWAWDFGDGDTDTLQNPSHFYTSFGTYQVSLISTSDSGCTDTSIQSYDVHPVPVADFTTADVCRYTAASFTDISNIPSGTITNWAWDFDDGQTSSAQNPANQYVAPGGYTVVLIVASDSGCTDTTQEDITIFPVPVAFFTTSNVCQDDFASFSDLSILSSGAIVSWEWDFGDAVTSTLTSPSHVYTAYGNYTAQLTVTTDNGCLDSIEKDIVIHPLPIPSFTVIDTCVYYSAAFTNTGTIGSGNVAGWTWDFGDFNYSTESNPLHLYSVYGTYPVTIVEVSDSGCTGQYVGQVTIHPQPDMDFIPDFPEGCSKLCVTYSDQSSVPDGSAIIGWMWDFGDGTTSTNQSPAPHCYTNDTDDIIDLTNELIATSAFGCLDTLTKEGGVTIWPLPIAEFSSSLQPATILYPYMTFTNLSTGAVEDPTIYEWNFGDTTSNWFGFDTLHVYDNQDSTTYLVELIATNEWGCDDTIEHKVVIGQDYTLFAPNAFTPDFDGINDYFMVQGIGLENLLEFEFSIFNRWGDRIYYYNTPNDPTWRGWDGFANGGKNLAQRDVYVWEIKTRDQLTTGHARHHYMGHVTLLR